MKDMMNSLQFKPAGIKENVENESKYHKIKIIGFAFLMAGIGTTYQSYLDGLVYRSGIYQKRALAGQETWLDYIDGENPATLWNLKNELDVLEGKPFKELKYMHTTTGSAFNTEYAPQTFWTEGNKDYQDVRGNNFAAEQPWYTSDMDGITTGSGRNSDGQGENWMDSTWGKAIEKITRDTAVNG